MGPVTVLAAALALLAAVVLAVGSVAQQRSASSVPESAHGLRLVRALARRPLWWLGIGGDLGGYLLQAAALAVGSLLLVQPLLVTSLLFALPLGAWWSGRGLSRADWGWATLLAGALGVFVVVGDPTTGVARAGTDAWLLVGAVLAGMLAAVLLAAVRTRGVSRAVLLAAGTGLCYGVGAALTKGVVDLVGDGAVALLTSWETYALVVVSAGGTMLQQSAFQAGALAAALPTMTVAEPVVAVVVGVAVLGERVRSDGVELVGIGVLAAVMVVATVGLARSAATAAPPAVARPT